jgi:hypothetical protein
MQKRIRRGSTLVELLVALLLLDLGLVMLGGMSAVAVRRIADANRNARATVAARTRIERLMAQPCGASSSGSLVMSAGVEERWSSQSAKGSRHMSDSIRVRNGRPPEVALDVRLPC